MQPTPTKTETLTIRLQPKVKNTLRKIAIAENRSLANMIDRLITEYSKTNNKGQTV